MDFYIVERSGRTVLSSIDNSWCRKATEYEAKLWKYKECLEWKWFYEHACQVRTWLTIKNKSPWHPSHEEIDKIISTASIKMHLMEIELRENENHNKTTRRSHSGNRH